MDIIIIVVLVLMILMFLTTIIKILILDRSERLKYLKNFKKGKFALIYLAAIPLHWIAFYNSNNNILQSLFSAVQTSIELVVLKFNYASVSTLMSQNTLFMVAMIVCYTLVVLNAILFTMTLTGQRVMNYCRKLKVRFIAKKVYIIVGLSNQNKEIIESIDTKKNSVLVIAPIKESEADYASVKRISYVNTTHPQKLKKVLNQLFKRYDNKTVNVIINDDDDINNLICVKQVLDIIKEQKIIDLGIDDTRGLSAYVFGKPENASTFYHFEEKSNGCIHYINKYKLIAIDFVDRYPFTQFMDEKYIDYSTATLKNNVGLNCVFIGFGQTSQQLYLTSIANNQFITLKDNKIEKVKVNYWIYDKEDPRNDKNLNHNYFRFAKTSLNDKEYLPLPDDPAKEEFFSLNINDYKFYQSIKDNLSKKDDKELLNYIIISYGSDMENLDFAMKICAKLKEWNLDEFTKVFVKVRNKELCKSVIDKCFAVEVIDSIKDDEDSKIEKINFITFANEGEVVYNINKIVAESKELMARHRHLSYDLVADNGSDEVKVKVKSLKQWYASSQVQRESNVYCCLSIRLKLQLMGFDYAKISDKRENENELYQKAYEKGDPIKYEEDKVIKGKSPIIYTNDIVKDSLRYNLAYLEHERWNAYMITRGFIPATIKQIEAGVYKDFKLRIHGNITTFEGLVPFRKIKAKNVGKSEEDTDVIRYDYQIMDDLVWMLSTAGYKIVKHEIPSLEDKKED